MGRYHLGAHGLLLQPLLWQDVNLQELWRGERGRISRLGEGLCLRQQGQGRPPQIWCHKHAKRNARKIERCETEKLYNIKKRPEQDEKGHEQCHPSFRCSNFTSILKLLQLPRIATKQMDDLHKVFPPILQRCFIYSFSFPIMVQWKQFSFHSSGHGFLYDSISTIYIYIPHFTTRNRGHDCQHFLGFSLPTSGSDLKVLESLLDEEIEYPQVGWEDRTCQTSLKLNWKKMTEDDRTAVFQFFWLFPGVVIVVH